MKDKTYLEIYRGKVIERIDLGQDGESTFMGAMSDVECFVPFNAVLMPSFLFNMKKVVENELGA